ncbi:hypothetical protein AXI59_07150 [Bacillus nakamurai]|uniref:Uncharacterized protein n=1 Tax=Bacillus nakamurai TaxID=1793963 RepID=A0A150F6M0_9BACI|nr:hypothetical protein AXI58_15920 [Bacillus nakamurai]KXZ24081.1 hypothetical protein AXI59_07150 [Bacillus nakamurai]
MVFSFFVHLVFLFSQAFPGGWFLIQFTIGRVSDHAAIRQPRKPDCRLLIRIQGLILFMAGDAKHRSRKNVPPSSLGVRCQKGLVQ